MKLKVASWNINSVRLRLDTIARYAAASSADVICLQETKTVDLTFPYEGLRNAGFTHILHEGQKSYNGVAILSRYPLEPAPVMDFIGNGHARHIAAVVAGKFTLHNIYIPAGGDIPDVSVNQKFAEKLAFVEALTAWSSSIKDTPAVIAGDFNIAPYEHDVWSHKQLLGIVSHTPGEVEALGRFREAGDWVDTARHFVPHHEKLYSWWSYRNRDWQSSNRGRRLDHIWVTQPLLPAIKAYETHAEARGWERPSDHVPIMLTMEHP